MKKSEVCFLFLLSLFCFACSDSADKEEMEFPEKDNLKVTFLRIFLLNGLRL